ncbi:MAG: dipicolinate synthase subunit B [Bacillota bacterium]|nr:MAG: dipicolinate synthase subunit B [Bacillota bacterium]
MLTGRRIGFAVCASHHNLSRVMEAVGRLVESGSDVYPIVSHSVATTATVHGTPAQWLEALERVTGRRPWRSIPEVEPIGPRRLLDALVIAPCTGTTMAKLANGFSDSAVLMAAKAVLRNQRPVVLAISTNDGLGINARNLATLLNTKNVYFVPFGQDNPEEKPNSLTSSFGLIPAALEAALAGKQLQPLLVAAGGM